MKKPNCIFCHKEECDSKSCMVCLQIFEEFARVAVWDRDLFDNTAFLRSKGLWMETPLPPDIQDMTSTISRYSRSLDQVHGPKFQYMVNMILPILLILW
jgi:hypothetical protein